MNQSIDPDLKQCLESLPIAFQEEFNKTTNILEFIYSKDDLSSWTKEALAFSTQSARSWETSLEYLKIAGDVASTRRCRFNEITGRSFLFLGISINQPGQFQVAGAGNGSGTADSDRPQSHDDDSMHLACR